MEHLESSIVLVQDIKNQAAPLVFLEVPSLDFLIPKKIIKKDDEWEVEEEPPQDNPFTKSILFHNKIRLTSAFEKLIIHQDMKAKQSLEDLQQIAIKILDKAKTIEYAGAGINFLSVMECENPGEEIKKRFLSSIPKLPIEKIIGGTFSYVCKKNDIVVTITISPVKKANDPLAGTKAISLSANYHLGIPYVKKIQEFIKEMPALKEDYLAQSTSLFG